MKEIRIAHVVLVFIGLLFIGAALFVTTERTNRLARMQAEQDDFNNDICIFILPDGSLYIPALELENEHIECHFRKP